MLMTDCEWCESLGTVFRGRCFACGTRFGPYGGSARIPEQPAAQPALARRPRLRLDLFGEALAQQAASDR